MAKASADAQPEKSLGATHNRPVDKSVGFADFNRRRNNATFGSRNGNIRHGRVELAFICTKKIQMDTEYPEVKAGRPSNKKEVAFILFSGFVTASNADLSDIVNVKLYQ